MSLLKKVEKYYSKELSDYAEKFPMLGSMLIESLDSTEYVGNLEISRLIDFSSAVGKPCGDSITELYRISCED